MSLSDIIYESINDTYSYGKYGDITVIIMNTNSYVNVTKLCNEYGKEFRHWKENNGSKELIKEVDDHIQARRNSDGPKPVSIITIGTGNNDLRGTYVHPLLVPHIASWISPKFAIKVSEIVNDYMVRQYKYIIGQKDTRIDELINEVRSLRDDNREMMNRLDTTNTLLNTTQTTLEETKDRLSNVEEELADTSDKLDNTINDLSIVQDKLDISVEDRAVKPFDKNKINKLVILKSLIYENAYYITCGQRDSVARAVRLRQKTYTKIDMIDFVPNSIYLFDHIKHQLKTNIKVSGRSIKLVKIDENGFIDTIKSLFDGRLKIDLNKKP